MDESTYENALNYAIKENNTEVFNVLTKKRYHKNLDDSVFLKPLEYTIVFDRTMMLRELLYCGAVIDSSTVDYAKNNSTTTMAAQIVELEKYFKVSVDSTEKIDSFFKNISSFSLKFYRDLAVKFNHTPVLHYFIKNRVISLYTLLGLCSSLDASCSVPSILSQVTISKKALKKLKNFKAPSCLTCLCGFFTFSGFVSCYYNGFFTFKR